MSSANGADELEPCQPTFSVENPADGTSAGSVAEHSLADARARLASATAAFEPWARTTTRERSEVLRRAHDLVLERRNELAELITNEMGKPLSESLGEVRYAADFLLWYSEEAVRSYGRVGASPSGGGTILVTHPPVGPCLLITPWNFPLAMPARKVAPALAAGCTVVLKPSELTPLTALLFEQVLLDAGVPQGVVNVVTTTDPRTTVEPLLADPRLRKLSFTGSTAVGKDLLAKSADRVLRTSLELGGNAPFVVLADSDIAAAVEDLMVAKFRNGGQACTAANRVLVDRSVWGEFLDRLCVQVERLVVGDGLDSETTIGPLVDRRALNKVKSLVDDATQGGSRPEVGGAPLERPGHFFQPTVLTGVDTAMPIAQQEIFGPVATLFEFDTDDDAVELANTTDAGLVGYVFGGDLERCRSVARRLEVGMVGLNTGLVSHPAAPFGGVKQSGLGREGGPEGLAEYQSTRYTLEAAR